MSDRAASVRSMIEAFNANDSAALRRCLHPDVTVKRPLPEVGMTSPASDAGSYHGVDEVIKTLGDLQERVGGMQVEIRTIEDVGADGALFEFLALIGPEGDRTAQLGWSLFRLEDGLIISTETFSTESAARAEIARAG